MVTVQDFTGDHAHGGDSTEFFLPTFSGFARVGYIRRFESGEEWAVCPDMNGGFGLSFMVGPETELYSRDLLVESFGSLKHASEVCEQAGGMAARDGDGAFRMRDYMTGQDVPTPAPKPDGAAGLPQCGTRVRVGGEFGEIKRVQCHDGAYSFEVALDGGGRSRWCAVEELTVVGGGGDR